MVSFLILAAATGLVAILLVFVVRLWIVLWSYHAIPRESLGLLIVAGSGGHTTEILRLAGSLSSAYSPRHYVIADSDEMSAKKIHSFETSRSERDSTAEDTQYQIHRIPRSREVRQSWLSSVFTTLHSMWFSFPLVHRIKPDVHEEFGLFSCVPPSTCPAFPFSVYCLPISHLEGFFLITVTVTGSLCLRALCNGPGTCVPICVSALLLGILGIKKVIIVYVESICRVETLSLSGKILYHLSDFFIVQWPALKEKYPKSVYLGRVV